MFHTATTHAIPIWFPQASPATEIDASKDLEGHTQSPPHSAPIIAPATDLATHNRLRPRMLGTTDNATANGAVSAVVAISHPLWRPGLRAGVAECGRRAGLRGWQSTWSQSTLCTYRTVVHPHSRAASWTETVKPNPGWVAAGGLLVS